MSSSYSPSLDAKPLDPPAAAPRPKKSSQRPSLSCTSCAKRKVTYGSPALVGSAADSPSHLLARPYRTQTKCDKTVPCSPCVKRGKSHLCRVEAAGGPPDESSAGPSVSLSDPRHAAFQELETFRKTVDLLRSRISGLESTLATAFSSLPPSSLPPPTPTFSQSYPYPPSGPYFDPRNDISVQPPSQPPSSYLPYLPPASSRETSEPQSAEGGSSQHGKTTSIADEVRSGEEVEASVALEFMALGRHRTFGVSNEIDPTQSGLEGPSGSGSQYQTSPHAKEDVAGRSPGDGGSHASPFLPSPSALYPSTSALAAAAPPQRTADALITHSIDLMGWHHGVVHGPSFKRELAEFWEWGDRRMDLCSPAWLALWYALLVVGVGNLAEGQAALLGISEDERSYLARTWFDCAMSCLYSANFLQNHSVFSLQAIGVLVVTGQDASTSNLIPTLLSTAISISQDMGMHRMSSDQEWEATMRSAPREVRVQSLIAREIRKRIFWALTSQDWFGIPYRRTYCVQPTQVTTPLPSNATDEDLMTGLLINRPPSSYTVVSKLLLWIQIARCLQEIFEHMDRNSNPSYGFLLEVDERLSGIISNCPTWLHDDGPTDGMPPCVDWIRNTFRISSNHKVLTLHRPFLHRAFRDPRFESSRRRAITASRAILREAARCSDSRLWTVPYHTSAAACVTLLDIFQRNGLPSEATSLAEERAEVLGALAALERMSETSTIARRGVALISNLVAEEARVREERERRPIVATTTNKSRGKKRGADDDRDGSEYSKAAKKMSLAEISPPSSGSPSASASSSSTSFPSPAMHPFGLKWDPTLDALPGAHQHHDPALFDFASAAPLPQEFLSVFLEHEFDPLDGAITDPNQGVFDAFPNLGGFGNGGSSVPGSWTM